MKNYLRLACKLILSSSFFINLSLLAIDDNNKDVFMEVLLKEMHLRSKNYIGKESGEIENGILNVNAVEIRPITPINDLFYRGEVLQPETKTVLSTKTGRVVYTAGLNNYAFGTLYDKNDNIKVKGTMLVALDKEDIDTQLNAAKRRKKIAKMGYEILKKMTDAHEKLSKHKMITTFELEQKRIELLSGLLKYETSNRKYDEKLLTYKDPYIYSEESGIVENIYVEPGAEIFEGQPILDMFRMNHASIKFKFPHTLVDLNIDKMPAYIYPQGSSIPIQANITLKDGDEDNAYFYIHNKLYSTLPLTSSQKKLKKVFSVYSVENMLGSDVEYYFVEEYLNRAKQVLCVPIETIRSDKNGKFIFKAEGINIHKNKEIPKIIKSKKVYIELGNIIENINYSMNTVRLSQSIKPNSNIQYGDIIIGNSDPKISNNETVIRVPPTWLFYPGQAVKIKIPSFLKKGVYVHNTAIIHSGNRGNYVYVIKNGILKLTKIYVDAVYNGYVLIISKELRDGQKIVLIDNENLFEYLYDSRQVNVIKTEEPPIFLSKAHATDITNPQGNLMQMQYMNNGNMNNGNMPIINSGMKKNAMFNQYFGSKYNNKEKSKNRVNSR
ncbi:MAG: hypothetical protein GY756_08365 [bacterium]|nr:hypothetical protein [bacterium]